MLDKRKLLAALDFFNKIEVNIQDVTSEAEKVNHQLAVTATYQYLDKIYTTKKLYYKDINFQNSVNDSNLLNSYFGPPVYWLDNEIHDWPKDSSEADIDSLIIDEIVQDGDEEFRSFLLQLASNKKTGWIQIITSEGRSMQYGKNFENNNHWHDLITLIKKIINSKGEKIDKKFFSKLVFKWQNGERVSLDPFFGDRKIISDLYQNIKSVQKNLFNMEILSLLKYKKQIILQGPPGTGKTKLAKEIAEKLIRIEEITIEDIKRMIKIGQTINSISDNISYEVISITDVGVTLKLENGNIQTRNYNHIIQAYSNLIANKGLTGGDSYQTAIAKYILDNWEDETLFKIIQFHPSYSYEDFVRGIVAESNGDKIEYKNVNKILGQFAKDAFENYELSKKENKDVQIDKWIRDSFNDFKDEIEKDIEQNEKTLTDNVGIFEVNNSCFRYGKEWGTAGRLNFADFKKLIRAVLKGTLRKEENNIPKEISLHAHYRSTYYLALLRFFFSKNQFNESTQILPLKNYILIIDEINRANLSSVLGELIYAMEYRGEKVESMYVVDDSNELVLPPNLYIIGTMNTADRSVGHIDYAIRRRFAFVDVRSKDLTAELNNKFHRVLYEKVAGLFDTNLSPEFEKKDVQLGHSYFIDKSEEGGSMAIRLLYEIKPILNEYVKDGILVGDNIKDIIESLIA